jgi:addiction module HigA family antidote
MVAGGSVVARVAAHPGGRAACAKSPPRTLLSCDQPLAGYEFKVAFGSNSAFLGVARPLLPKADISPGGITGIINGQRAVSADTALRLACYFGTSPEFWINMQAGHDLSKARAEIGKQIMAEVRPHS